MKHRATEMKKWQFLKKVERMQDMGDEKGLHAEREQKNESRLESAEK